MVETCPNRAAVPLESGGIYCHGPSHRVPRRNSRSLGIPQSSNTIFTNASLAHTGSPWIPAPLRPGGNDGGAPPPLRWFPIITSCCFTKHGSSILERSYFCQSLASLHPPAGHPTDVYGVRSYLRFLPKPPKSGAIQRPCVPGTLRLHITLPPIAQMASCFRYNINRHHLIF